MERHYYLLPLHLWQWSPPPNLHPWMSVAEQCLMNSLAKTPRNQPDKPRASSRSASPSVSPLTFSAAPDPFSPRIRVVLFASLQRPLKRNRFQEKQMANSLGRWRGREGWGGGDKDWMPGLTWGCTVLERENISSGTSATWPACWNCLSVQAERRWALFSPSFFPSPYPQSS